MLTKLTLGEKLKNLQLAKGYNNTEQLASVINIPKTTLIMTRRTKTLAMST